MAYTQKHLRNHVMKLQKYLHGISYYNPQIPRIVPDGIYDRETETAIRAFQREYHLPETGRTDMQTWNKLINVYKHYISGTAQKINIFPSPNHVVKEGDTGLIVYILQSMLNVIGEYYDNMPNAQISGTFGSDTAQCIKNFQKRSNLPQSGNVDRQTWNMLVKTAENVEKR